MGWDGMEGTEVAGAVDTATSLYFGNIAGGRWVQILESGVRLISCASRELVAEWSFPDGKKISACTCNSTQIVVASGSEVRHLRVAAAAAAGGGGGVAPGGAAAAVAAGGRGGVFEEVGAATMEHEVACLDITPPVGKAAATVCVVGLWTDISVRVLDLASASLAELCKELLGGEIIPRSVLHVELEEVAYIMCALGDGILYTFEYSATPAAGGSGMEMDSNVQATAAAALSSRARVSLGTQPITLSTFNHAGHQHVFAASDRPTVIYSSNTKLVYSNVNLPEVSRMCSLNTDAFPNCITLVGAGGLTIGAIDEIQKLQIKSYPLAASPYRIAYQEGTTTFVVLTMSEPYDGVGLGGAALAAQNAVRLLHHQTFEQLDVFQLEPNEEPLSVVSTTFTGDDAEYFCVGTAVALVTESEPTKGRVLVFKAVDGKLLLVHSTPIRGAPYSMAAFNGKLLLAVSSSVILFKWNMKEDGSAELVKECGNAGHITVVQIKTKGDFIIVGDLMRSVSLLVYKPMTHTLENVSYDYKPNWMTSVAMVDVDTFIGMETSLNMFVLKRNVEPTDDAPLGTLDTVGQYHLGGYVNVIRPGSLAMRTQAPEEAANDNSMLFCTREGAIGMVLPIDRELYECLEKVQARMREVTFGVGNLNHDGWRSFKTQNVTASSTGVIDGDLIERFVDLSAEEKATVVAEPAVLTLEKEGTHAEVSAELLTQHIEDLIRMH